MKKIGAALMMLAVAEIAAAGTFTLRTTTEYLTFTDIDGKINDLVTDKFTKKYPSEIWTIYVQSTTANADSDKSAMMFVSIGVARKGLNGQQPATRSWASITRDQNVVNASLKDKKPLLVKQVRLVLQDMMDACEKSPNCDIDK